MANSKVKKIDLLTVLESNRAYHKAEYQEALKIWRKKAVKALAKAHKKAVESNGEVIEPFPLQNLPKPVNYLASYDLMIAKLNAEVEEVVELTDREFQSYWMDNWDWKDMFVGSTSLYNSRG